MIFFLAQIPTASTAQMNDFLIGGAALLGIVVLALKAWALSRDLFGKDSRKADHLQESVTKLERQIDKLPTQDCVEGLERRIVNMETKFDTEFSDLNTKRERQNAELHEKINTVRDDVQYIRGKLEGMG
jgi:hypothetical protein